MYLARLAFVSVVSFVKPAFVSVVGLAGRVLVGVVDLARYVLARALGFGGGVRRRLKVGGAASLGVE